MKLRNKKTGRIGELIQYADFAYDKKGEFYIEINGGRKEYYDSFQQMLDAGWEVYRQPQEPLIKDEKIRKAVRVWAEVNNIKEVHYDSGCNELNDIARNTISFNARIVEQKFIEDKDYTIAELCGEEE